MKIDIHNKTSDFNTYRAARVKSLFNVDKGSDFYLNTEIPIEDQDWRIGVIVGPSGSGKTSMGAHIFGENAFWAPNWPEDKPIIDVIGEGQDFDAATGALSSVGLGNVPTWLRPFQVLSNGEQYRAGLARLLLEEKDKVILDEFTSVVDRQIAKIGALAFSKSWKRRSGQALILTPHYDVIEWLEPDWVFDTGTGHFDRRRLRRPKFELEIWKVDGNYWPLFEPHHYLKLPRMVSAKYYVGTVNNELVAHLCLSTAKKGKNVEARASRLVVMPEWQGAGVGTRFLNEICQACLEGRDLSALPGRRITTVFHTSHPGLAAALRRDPKWRQLSARLYGDNKKSSSSTLKKASKNAVVRGGYGGHFRAVQGFRYYGERAAE